jgi:hypothetical protein
MVKAGGTKYGDAQSGDAKAGDRKVAAPRTRDAAEPQRSRRMRAVADLLPAAGGLAFRRFGFVQSSIVSRWPEIVGARYAAVSCPESIRFPPGRKSKGVLNLVIEGAHAPMMQHVAPVIVERVNRFFGYEAVERVSFRQGEVRAKQAPRRAAPPSLRHVEVGLSPGQPEDLPDIPAELGDSLRAVVDPELRACLESLARGLASGEGMPVVTTIPLVGKVGRGKFGGDVKK